MLQYLLLLETDREKEFFTSILHCPQGGNVFHCI